MVRKVAVVTGATSGIGRAVAVRLARAGYAVVAVGRRRQLGEALAAELAGEGLEASFEPADIALAGDASRFVESAVATYGRLDVVVNNAAVYRTGSVEETEPETWELVLSVNLGGVYRVSRAAIPHLRAAGGGSIVNVASVHALATQARVAAYAASKGAIVSLTRQMAIDLAPDGIRVNAVLVGGVDTPMAAESFAGAGTTPEEAGWSVDPRVLGRIGRPDEIATVVEFLCSPGSSMMTGAAVVVDAGLLARL